MNLTDNKKVKIVHFPFYCGQRNDIRAFAWMYNHIRNKQESRTSAFIRTLPENMVKKKQDLKMSEINDRGNLSERYADEIRKREETHKEKN